MRPGRPGHAGRSSGGPHPGREAGGDLHLELVPRREALARVAIRSLAALALAGFDDDGTLWSEQPMHVQLAFAIDRVKALAPLRPHPA